MQHELLRITSKKTLFEKMTLLSSIISFILWIYVHSPINLTDEFIDSLQMTSNPDSYLTPPQTIRKTGYPSETHSILTPDGFILELHRIPNEINKGEKNSTPILLVHGYADSSAAWIALGPGQALAYLLADEGYDVWMMNSRGNTFSRSHANYTPMEHVFWDFSFHEIGIYDIPTTIDFILSKTNHKQLFCVCHSIGNAELYIMSSLLPKYNEKIIAQVSLAPVFRRFPPFTDALVQSIVFDALNYLYWNTPGSWLERDLLMKLIVLLSTTISVFGYNAYDLCQYIFFNLQPDHINSKVMPAVYNNYPAGTSVKATIHLMQLFDSFTYFDYGSEENLKIYGTRSAPKYNISNVQIPIRIYHAKFDETSDSADIRILYDELPEKEGLVTIPDQKFSHVDFIWNKNAKKLVYDDVIAFINYAFMKNAS